MTDYEKIGKLAVAQYLAKRRVMNWMHRSGVKEGELVSAAMAPAWSSYQFALKSFEEALAEACPSPTDPRS